jgi:hypothetical protein
MNAVNRIDSSLALMKNPMLNRVDETSPAQNPYFQRRDLPFGAAVYFLSGG